MPLWGASNKCLSCCIWRYVWGFELDMVPLTRNILQLIGIVTGTTRMEEATVQKMCCILKKKNNNKKNC